MNRNSYCIGHVWTLKYKLNTNLFAFSSVNVLYCDVNLCVRSSCTSFYAVSWIPQGPQLNNFFRDTVRLMLNSGILICVKIDSKFYTLFIISIGWNTVDCRVKYPQGPQFNFYQREIYSNASVNYRYTVHMYMNN